MQLAQAAARGSRAEVDMATAELGAVRVCISRTPPIRSIANRNASRGRVHPRMAFPYGPPVRHMRSRNASRDQEGVQVREKMGALGARHDAMAAQVRMAVCIRVCGLMRIRMRRGGGGAQHGAATRALDNGAGLMPRFDGLAD